MPLLSPHFPAGRSGAGLLLLRLSAALVPLGRWTRVTAILCTGPVFELVQGADPIGSGAQRCDVTAIWPLGADACSMGAGMVGRRMIILRKRPT
jgi:hypothetical protein